MIIYKAELTYESLQCGTNDKETLNPEIDDKKIVRIINDVNDDLGFCCGLDRLIKESNGKKLSRKDLTSLTAEDFSVNAEKMYKKPKSAIGFV